MKKVFYTLFFICFTSNFYSQIILQTDFIGKSKYIDQKGNQTDGKGSMQNYQASIQIPVYAKVDSLNRPFLWGIALSGIYSRFDNESKKLNTNPKLESSIQNFPSQILNAQFSVMHLRPIGKKWSLLSSLGFGIYMCENDENIISVGSHNFLGEGAVLFINQLHPNLKLGIGLSLNNAFGYPMVYPGIYIDWNLGDKYYLNFNMSGITIGVVLNDRFSLNIIGKVNGSLALTENQMFSHSYVRCAIMPELKMNEHLSACLSLGVSIKRPAYFQERTIKDFFKDRENEAHFAVAPCCSLSIIYR